MKREIEIIQQPRQTILDLISDLSIDQVNTIPAGFNNNIIWNLGHMVAAQQGICYKRCNLPVVVPEDFFGNFISGTKPERFFNEAEYENIKQLLFTTLEKLEADYDSQIFSGYTSGLTRYNVNLSNIDEAIAFLPFHDGLHIGYIMSLRKLV